jgi:hypothetical protein
MEYWYLIALMALAVIGLVLLLYRQPGPSRRRDQHPAPSRPQPDYAQARAAHRLTHRSATGRALGTVAVLQHQATRLRS